MNEPSFFDEICEAHGVPWGECLVQHLRVSPREAIAMLQGCIDEGDAIMAELGAAHADAEM